MILSADVDLIWNGGIGTYIKASNESHSDVRDKANNVVRIDDNKLKCRVIGEGGNLGLTQQARIRFALNGGKIFSDWIDNSGGVDCSDREVNIKILLDSIVSKSSLSITDRNCLLNNMTNDVVDLVLADNYRQARVISLSSIESLQSMEWYLSLIKDISEQKEFSYITKYISHVEDIHNRKAAERYLSTPEIAVLLGAAKAYIYNEILATGLAKDKYLNGMLLRYFPRKVTYEIYLRY